MYRKPTFPAKLLEREVAKGAKERWRKDEEGLRKLWTPVSSIPETQTSPQTLLLHGRGGENPLS